MSRINVNTIDDQKKLNVLKKSVEKHGLSYVSCFIGVGRLTLNRYFTNSSRYFKQHSL